MQYYVSKTTVQIKDGKVDGYEEALTKPDKLKPTKEMLRRMRAIGIENVHLCEHPKNSRRYGKLVKAATLRRKEVKMTKADVAEIVEQFEKEKESENSFE